MDDSTNPIPLNQDVDQNDAPPLTNGDAIQALSIPAGGETSNPDSFAENAGLPFTTVDVNKAAPPDVDPEGPTPVDDVTGGIQPVADFLPKETPPHSHPTPPPDQPLTSGEADVDTVMAGTEDAELESAPEPGAASEPVGQLEPAPIQDSASAPEQSLVRPRDDDEADADEERATKRTRVEDVEGEEQLDAVAAQSAPAIGGDSFAVRQDAESAPAPATVRAQVIPIDAPADPSSADAPGSAESAHAPGASAANGVPVQPLSETPVQTSVQAEAQPSVEGGAVPATAPLTATKYDTKPMTSLQKSVLVEKTKNLKKTKHSVPFLRPVDPSALNIPTYPEIIKHPMDLGTMDQKLKSNQYESVQAFADDFNLIVQNSRTFNGDAHPVTQNAWSMKAYFDKMMEAVPSADQPSKAPQRRASPTVKTQPKREQQPRQPAAPPAAGTFALQGDGVPEIRRTSTAQRPARAIKPPANRDIPYAKPRRKETQLELRFCDHVLTELRSPKYGHVNSVFLMPVDPVALNIPHYRQIIKKPMDLSTMGQKLKQGEYGKAGEFEADFKLMIENCVEFNPAGNPVRDMGIQFQRYFKELWSTRKQWEQQNKPESARGTSDDDDSDADENEDDDAPEDEKEQTIQALQKQLADMQNMIAGIAAGGTKAAKVKKSKSKDKDSRRASKVGGTSAGPKASKSAARAPKPMAKKSKKEKQVTYDEKQEISDAVGKMEEDQLQHVTDIITTNVAKYKDQEDMELEIDELPNNVQHMLLKYVRSIFGRSKAAGPPSPPDDGEMDDDKDFEMAEGGPGYGAGSKRKKHRPMGKREQQDTIQSLNASIERFKQVQTCASEFPGGSNVQAKIESSGDEESEESEEE